LREHLGFLPGIAEELEMEGIVPPGSGSCWQDELFPTDAMILEPSLRAELLFTVTQRLATSLPYHIAFITQRYPGLTPEQFVHRAHLDDLAVVLAWATATPGPLADTLEELQAFYTKFPSPVMRSAGPGEDDGDEGSADDNEKNEETTWDDYGDEDETGTANATTAADKCTYCRKPGHEVKDCWKKNGNCLRCGQLGHRAADCTAGVDDSPPAWEGRGGGGGGGRVGSNATLLSEVTLDPTQGYIRTTPYGGAPKRN
jgi:hypothetical protein